MDLFRLNDDCMARAYLECYFCDILETLAHLWAFVPGSKAPEGHAGKYRTFFGVHLLWQLAVGSHAKF